MSEALRPLLIVGVMMLGTLVLLVWGRRQRKASRAATAHATADAIATHLQLRFLSGDPGLNLAHPGPGVADVRLEGMVRGRLTTVVYRLATRDVTTLTDVLLGGETREVQSVAHLEVACRARRGRFEVRHRATGGLDARSVFPPNDPLPRRRFGSALDERLVVDADDVDVVARIAPHLGPSTTLGYVHVVGESGRLRFEMGASSLGWQGTTSVAALCFPRAVELVGMLAACADSLELD